MPEILLEVKNLRTSFFDEGAETRAVDGMSFSVEKGEYVAVIGESGSGKSVCALSILRLVPYPPGLILGGEILFEGRDLLKVSDREIERIRGSEISMVFQEPSTALNPVIPIGRQISESLLVHKRISKSEAQARASVLLSRLDIPDAEKRLKFFPHQLSGGMKQRAMIAMSMCNHPKLLIADEPTTALDTTIQAQVLEQLDDLRRETGMSLVLITHNLGIVARYADKVEIVYGGKVVEEGPVDEIFDDPRHPYTIGLIRAVPRLDSPRGQGIRTIEGEPPDMSKVPRECCAFAPRCPKALPECSKVRPPMAQAGRFGHSCACLRMEE
jgi:oligopeptide/dipeptide ABC transporter ATP-binding protein